MTSFLRNSSGFVFCVEGAERIRHLLVFMVAPGGHAQVFAHASHNDPLFFKRFKQLARPLAFRPDKIGDRPHHLYFAREIGGKRLKQAIKRLSRFNEPLNIAL